MKPKFMVQFLVERNRYEEFTNLFDFNSEDYTHTGVTEEVWANDEYFVVSGMITSEYASVLKMGNKFVAERMQFFYIDDSLKDKYRR